MKRINHGGEFQIDSHILESLSFEEGDFIEQQIVKGEYIILRRLEGDRLQHRYQEKISELISRLENLKQIEGTSELLAFLVETEERTNVILDRKSERSSSDLMEVGHSSTEERDMSILDVIFKGGRTLSDISKTLELPQSSVSESLNNLHSQGLIDIQKENDGKRGRPKHLYSLTYFGEQHYQAN